MKKWGSLLPGFVFALLTSITLLASLAYGKSPATPPPSPLSDREAMRHVLEGFYGIPHVQLRGLEERMPFPDLNLPVALFISQQAKVSVDLLISWRQPGKAWLQIAQQLKLSPTLFFLPIPEGPLGPPYGRLYGYYWKYQQDKGTRIILSDKEIAELVHLRIASTYFRLPPSQIMQLRAQGKSFYRIYGQEYRKRHPVKGKSGGAGRPLGNEGDGGGGQEKEKEKGGK